MNTYSMNHNLNKQKEIPYLPFIPYILVIIASSLLLKGLTTAILEGPIKAISPFKLFQEGMAERTVLIYGISGIVVTLYSIPFYIGAFGVNNLRLWSWKLLKITSIVGIICILCLYTILIIEIIIGEEVPVFLKILRFGLWELIVLISLLIFLSKHKKIFDSSQRLVNQTKLACVTFLTIFVIISYVGWGKYQQIQTLNEITTILEDRILKNRAKQEENKIFTNQPAIYSKIKFKEIGISATSAQRLQNDNTIIGERSGRLLEIDNQGNTIWEYKPPNDNNKNYFKTIRHVTRLPNGNTLMSDENNNQLLEISPNKEIVWMWSDPILKPIFAQRLKNGNTLITASNNLGTENTVLEVLPTCNQTLCPNRDIVWMYDGGKSNAFVQATRLDNGNTLIVSMRRNGDGIIEINKEGNKVWQYGKGKSFANAYRLSNGNTLIAQYYCDACKEGYIFIVNSKGELVWSFTDLNKPQNLFSMSIYPTDTGSILVTVDYRVIEIDIATKEIIWAVN